MLSPPCRIDVDQIAFQAALGIKNGDTMTPDYVGAKTIYTYGSSGSNTLQGLSTTLGDKSGSKMLKMKADSTVSVVEVCVPTNRGHTGTESIPTTAAASIKSGSAPPSPPRAPTPSLQAYALYWGTNPISGDASFECKAGSVLSGCPNYADTVIMAAFNMQGAFSLGGPNTRVQVLSTSRPAHQCSSCCSRLP
jgi:hypothetical protein